MLYWRCGQLPAEGVEHLIALVPRCGEHADLDQLVAGQVAVDLREHRWIQARFADYHHRLQLVSVSAQRAALRGCEFERHDSIAV